MSLFLWINGPFLSHFAPGIRHCAAELARIAGLLGIEAVVVTPEG